MWARSLLDLFWSSNKALCQEAKRLPASLRVRDSEGRRLHPTCPAQWAAKISMFLESKKGLLIWTQIILEH